MIMWKGFPGRSVGTIVLTHRSPGTLAQVGPPPLPVLLTNCIFSKPLPLSAPMSLRARRGPNCFPHCTSDHAHDLETERGYDAPPADKNQADIGSMQGPKLIALFGLSQIYLINVLIVSREENEGLHESPRLGGKADCLGLLKNRQAEPIEYLTPDHSLLIEQIFNHFDTVPHLDLSFLRHRKHGPDQLAGFHIHERGNAFTRRFFEITAKTSQRNLLLNPSRRACGVTLVQTIRKCMRYTESIP